MRKARMGLLLIATQRFRNLGQETEEGSYESRKRTDTLRLVQQCEAFCEPVCPGPLYTREDLAKAMDMFRQQKVDCVLALFLSWSEDFLWIRFLRDMPPVPILFACIEKESVPYVNTEAETDFVEFLAAGGLVGALEASGSVQRFARPMLKTVMGPEEKILSEAKVFCQAACLRTELFQATFALLACYNEVMWSTYLDPYLLFQKAGPELRFLSVAMLEKEIGAVPEDLVRQNCEILRRK